MEKLLRSLWASQMTFIDKHIWVTHQPLEDVLAFRDGLPSMNATSASGWGLCKELMAVAERRTPNWPC